MFVKCVFFELFLYLLVYYIYVVVVVFEVFVDVINIVNYLFNVYWFKDEGVVNDFCFFFFLLGG